MIRHSVFGKDAAKKKGSNPVSAPEEAASVVMTSSTSDRPPCHYETTSCASATPMAPVEAPVVRVVGRTQG